MSPQECGNTRWFLLDALDNVSSYLGKFVKKSSLWFLVGLNLTISVWRLGLLQPFLHLNYSYMSGQSRDLHSGKWKCYLLTTDIPLATFNSGFLRRPGSHFHVNSHQSCTTSKTEEIDTADRNHSNWLNVSKSHSSQSNWEKVAYTNAVHCLLSQGYSSKGITINMLYNFNLSLDGIKRSLIGQS